MEISNSPTSHQLQEERQSNVTITTTTSSDHHHDDQLIISSSKKLLELSSSVLLLQANNNKDDQVVEVDPAKKRYRYRECMKNHAASIGGNSRDGCGEFMPSSDHPEATNDDEYESLYCSVCSCHRNFHRKELPQPDHHHHHHHHSMVRSYPATMPHPHPRPPMIMPYNYHVAQGSLNKRSPSHLSEDQEQDNHRHHNHGNLMMMVMRPPNGGGGGGNKRRFRTKFSQEQREKMLRFAEGVGWKIQKQEESVVQSFCQEIGVKRRVLKVWMHNNKHSLANKN